MDHDDLRFSVEHLWIRLDEDNLATIGLSDAALDPQDEVSRLRLPPEGEEIIKDETFGRITTSRPSLVRLYAPLSGEVAEVNEDVLDSPELLLEDPFEEGWLIRVEIANWQEFDQLMTRDEYEDFLDEGGIEEEEDLEDLEDDEEDEDDLDEL